MKKTSLDVGTVMCLTRHRQECLCYWAGFAAPRTTRKPMYSGAGVQPEFASAHYNLANALVAKGENLEEAAESYRLVMRLNPEDRSSRERLGAVLRVLAESSADSWRVREPAFGLKQRHCGGQAMDGLRLSRKEREALRERWLLRAGQGLLRPG